MTSSSTALQSVHVLVILPSVVHVAGITSVSLQLCDAGIFVSYDAPQPSVVQAYTITPSV